MVKLSRTNFGFLTFFTSLVAVVRATFAGALGAAGLASGTFLATVALATTALDGTALMAFALGLAAVGAAGLAGAACDATALTAGLGRAADFRAGSGAGCGADFAGGRGALLLDGVVPTFAAADAVFDIKNFQVNKAQVPTACAVSCEHRLV